MKNFVKSDCEDCTHIRLPNGDIYPVGGDVDFPRAEVVGYERSIMVFNIRGELIFHVALSIASSLGIEFLKKRQPVSVSFESRISGHPYMLPHIPIPYTETRLTDRMRVKVTVEEVAE